MNIERYTHNIETCAYLEKKRKEEKKQKTKNEEARIHLHHKRIDKRTSHINLY